MWNNQNISTKQKQSRRRNQQRAVMIKSYDRLQKRVFNTPLVSRWLTDRCRERRQLVLRGRFGNYTGKYWTGFLNPKPNFTYFGVTKPSKVGAVVKALAFRQCVPCSIPGSGVIYGLSVLLVLYSAPRGSSPGIPVFPSPHRPTFLNSNSIWIIVKQFILSPWLAWLRNHSLCLTLNSHLHFFFYIQTKRTLILLCTFYTMK